MKSYYSVDHRILFLLGYIFYFFTPLIVGSTNLFDGFPGIELYKGFYRRIPIEKIQVYFWITLSWLPAFYLGHYLFKVLKPYKRPLSRFESTADSARMPIVAIFLLMLLGVFTFLGRGSLFGGYSSYDEGVRGKFSTLLILYNFFVIYSLVTIQKTSLLLIGGCILAIFFLLTMGGRMYVFQTFIVVLVYKTSFAIRRWNQRQIALVLIIGFFVGSAMGIWRQSSGYNLSKASYSFFAEPVFTWFSTCTFLLENDIPTFNFPANFLTSFINLVPNTVFSLRKFVVSVQDMGYVTQSPLGADSVWSTLVINFGSIGSFFFVLITGFMLNFLRHNSENSRFGTVYYIMVCGLLPFQFFRDGFYIIHKQLFFNFLLLPALILIFLRFFLYKSENRSPATLSNHYNQEV